MLSFRALLALKERASLLALVPAPELIEMKLPFEQHLSGDDPWPQWHWREEVYADMEVVV
jgi:hypothetical protein